MSIQTMSKFDYEQSLWGFRPLSGLCLFRLFKAAPTAPVEVFPSPIGVMSIQTIMGLLDDWNDYVSVPYRGYVYSD